MIKLQGLLDQADQHAANRDWGLCANAHTDIAETLWEDGQWREALRHFVVVAILQLQGGRNSPHHIPGVEEQTPEFDPRGFVGSHVLLSAYVYLDENGGTVDDLRPMFDDVASAIWVKDFPLSRDRVWRQLRTRIVEKQHIEY